MKKVVDRSEGNILVNKVGKEGHQEEKKNTKGHEAL